MLVNLKPITLLFAGILIANCDCYRILGVFPFASPSHYFLGNELMKGLAEARHDVTIATVFHEKSPPSNGKYRQIVMDDLLTLQKALFEPIANVSSGSSVSMQNPFKMATTFPRITINITESTISHPKFQRLVTSGERFDVLIVTQFNLEAVKALAPLMGAHLVLFNNNAMHSWMGHFVGIPVLPSINPEIIMGYTGQMNYRQRLLNTVVRMLFSGINYLYDGVQVDLARKYISKDVDLVETQYNVALVLSNSHSSLNRAQSSVPVIKDIAGFHVKPPKKLPDGIKKYLDEAENGAIYFSMGSNIRGADLPMAIKQGLMNAFAKRKERILWKFEEDDLPGKPENVRIEKWLPQSDILAHPNVKLFITHGGFLSTIETVYHGVPTVAIPVMGDQLMNARVAQADGYAFVLDFQALNEESISHAIEEVLTNDKYKNNAKYRSEIFHDRPMKPLEEAIYWVEYIVRHKGAPHLRVDYLNLRWYEYYLLDVFATFIVAAVVVFYIFKKILVLIFRSCCGKRSKKLKKQ
ncbi:unnamed protein product [Phyllotreta striolata]|uniref:UDP-glucuronosyltransferase n=1 Tax=Phyllotreta striolata TaxID=444603 RepID=A0A9N9TGY4_PHYSR|nr:unnamed protein product [Phyllotreta striolata]